MKEQEELSGWIDRYRNNELSVEELETFRELLKNNPLLRKEERIDKELDEILEDQDEIELRRKIRDITNKKMKDKDKPGLWNPILLLAATILLFIVSAFMIRFIPRVTRHPAPRVQQLAGVTKDTPARTPFREEVVPADTGRTNRVEQKQIARTKTLPTRTRLIRDTHLLAANYQPNPLLENLVGSVTRNVAIDVRKAPETVIQMGKGTILFKWDAFSADSLRLRIMNNRGRMVLDTVADTTGRVSISSGRLQDGLYYYKYSFRDDILYFGKFTLKK
jgi:hypothetical protein